jgi:hypothetical protein
LLGCLLAAPELSIRSLSARANSASGWHSHPASTARPGQTFAAGFPPRAGRCWHRLVMYCPVCVQGAAAGRAHPGAGRGHRQCGPHHRRAHPDGAAGGGAGRGRRRHQVAFQAVRCTSAQGCSCLSSATPLAAACSCSGRKAPATPCAERHELDYQTLVADMATPLVSNTHLPLAPAVQAHAAGDRASGRHDYGLRLAAGAGPGAAGGVGQPRGAVPAARRHLRPAGGRRGGRSALTDPPAASHAACRRGARA